jgi:uncharacterized protein YjbI with pentapeptide repeats
MLKSDTIGNKITEARKKINISQAQLAERLFISPQAVGKWERGESMPDIITFNRLAEILGVDLNYFSESSQFANQETAHKKSDIRESEQTETTDSNIPESKERELLTNFSGSALSETDFAGVSAPKRKFIGSDLRGANFSDADLSGSTFMGSDVREANFDGTNLTDCTLSAIDLKDASFSKTVLVRTEFNASDLAGAKFTDSKLMNVKFIASDLTKTRFENCSFNGVDFKSSDLSGVCLDGQTFTDVKFEKTALKETTFKGATLKNVSFRASFALTNRYYKTLKTIHFDGTRMDKLTYAALKGMGVDLSKAIII